MSSKSTCGCHTWNHRLGTSRSRWAALWRPTAAFGRPQHSLGRRGSVLLGHRSFVYTLWQSDILFLKMYAVIALLIILNSPVLSQETPEVTALPQTTTDIETPICIQEQQNAFLSTLPNAAVCGASLETVSSPPLHHPQLLDIAFNNLCTKD